jgi:hypothetical protein
LAGGDLLFGFGAPVGWRLVKAQYCSGNPADLSVRSELS